MNNWKLSEWLASPENKLLPMTKREIEKGIDFLRSNYYPIPADCPKEDCREWRPACLITCKIAMHLCRDW
jgi:hypothetical protein